jgi:RNA polymerase sigma-70 factor, ECF subfamily
MENVETFRELIEQSASGNSESFKVLYEQLVDKIFAYVRYRTSSEEDATDVTQEVFIDLYKSISTFTYRSPEEFYGFVYTITKRKLAKYYAHSSTQAIKTTDEFDEERHGVPGDDPENSHDVSKALATLDETTQEIVVLHHWSRYTFPEIAALIGMKESAVRVRHHRALKTLSVLLLPR